MASINRLKPGQTVYIQTRGGSVIKYDSYIEIHIQEVNVESGYVIAKSGHIPGTRKYNLSQIKQWRISKPKSK